MEPKEYGWIMKLVKIKCIRPFQGQLRFGLMLLVAGLVVGTEGSPARADSAKPEVIVDLRVYPPVIQLDSARDHQRIIVQVCDEGLHGDGRLGIASGPPPHVRFHAADPHCG